MKKLLQKLRQYETGATMVEYGLMVALIAVVAWLQSHWWANRSMRLSIT